MANAAAFVLFLATILAAAPWRVDLHMGAAAAAAPVSRRELAAPASSASSLVAELMGSMTSPLSKSAASSYAQLFERTGSVADLCEKGHLYCNAATFESYYERQLQLDEKVEVKDIPVFFRESELALGEQVTIADPRLQSAALEINRQAITSSFVLGESKYTYLNVGKVPERAFLPAELAQTLPFTATSASQIFQVDEASTLAKQSREAVEICKEGAHVDGTTGLQGEAAACAVSVEDLQSLLSSPMLLGPHDSAHVEALTTDSSLQEGRSFTGKVVQVSLKASEASRHAVCHNLMYPSALYFCHYLAHTRVYSVTLQQQQQLLLHAVAMCHMDTHGWNPSHLAFLNLGTSPGRSEACHWVLPGSVTFVPTA